MGSAQFNYGHPRIVPGRGRYAGQAFVLHGCVTDGPFTYPEARAWLADLRHHPITNEQYAEIERRGHGGMATHYLTDDHGAIDPEKIAAAIRQHKDSDPQTPHGRLEKE